MRKLTESDFFKDEINKGNTLMGRATKIISGLEPSTVILNQILYPDIKKKILSVRREKIVLDMGKAIEHGSMVLFTTAPDKRLPDVMPFLIYKKEINGKFVEQAAVNLCSLVKPVKLPSGEITYEMIDVSKVYSVLYGSYLAMDRFTPNAIVSPSILYDSAVLWAAMFTKPIFDAIGLHNPERNQAFMYFSIKFFLGYYMGCNEEQRNSIALKFVGKKSDQILLMEEIIEERELNLYEGLIGFMQIMFNNEITQIKGIRVDNLSNSLNVSYYLSRFVMSFGSNALLALCSYPYFIYVVIAAYGKTKMLNDKSFDRIFSTYKRELNRLLVNIVKE